ncbi:glycosyltransferase [Butyricicoccus faecihominis]|uniref:glycosyltransferase n=1 Tax=Butyricicoccus faecihominis TaxID=1712515 RepID=UPI00247ACAE5|nr:glycosyltransferase [Butyricicoccus faecihominis]MCQ5129397.1 glycosyltransferase [Butyricicoccus faecihominis]
MNKPLFSVGIISYNQKEYIFDCIDSILRQNYPAIELIIADDHSYDFDIKKIETYIKTNSRSNLVRVEVFSNSENIGIVKNCNKCIAHMSGVYIKTIAADDAFYSNDTLSKMQRLLVDPEKPIICARAKAITNEGKPTQDIYPTDYDFTLISDMTTQELYTYMITRPWCPIFAPCVFMTKSFFQKMGGYDENFVYTEDWPFWIHIVRSGYHITFSNEITIRYRYGGISNQSTNEFAVNHLRARHYLECAQILEKEIPYLKKHGTYNQVLRCKYSAKAIKMRRELEFFWSTASFKHKLIFRIKMAPTLLYIKLMSAITHHSRFHIKQECLALCVLGVLYKAPIQSCQWDQQGKWLAAAILLLAILVIIKIVANAVLSLLSMRAKIKTCLR